MCPRRSETRSSIGSSGSTLGGRAGLGLTIAKTFIEAHGERIWVEDVPEGGARFVFTLPVVSADDAGG